MAKKRNRSTAFPYFFKQITQQAIGFLAGGLVNAVAGKFSIDLSFDQTGGFHGLQVLGNSSLGQRDLFHHIPTETAALPDQYLKDSDPGRMSQCFGNTGQPVVTFGKAFCSCVSHIDRKITMNKFQMQILA